MTKEEYIKKMREGNFYPGFDIINKEFNKLYPGQEPLHFVKNNEKNFFEIAVYKRKDGYFHIVTLGFSNLFADEKAFGQEYNGLGYELTMKVKAKNADELGWALHLMETLDELTEKRNIDFKKIQKISFNGGGGALRQNSLLTGIIVVPDTELKEKNTIHGKLSFLQLVGVTSSELNFIKEDNENVNKLLQLIRQDTADLITDIDRKESYL